MRKLSLLMLIILEVCLIGGSAKLKGQQPEASREFGEATPVEDGVLTPQQLEHSKLYEEYEFQRKIRDLVLKFGKWETGRIVCGFLSLVPVPDLIPELTQKSDAIVIATFVSKTSQITARGGAIFTDFELRVEEFLKYNLAKQPPGTITVTRPGGRVLLFGKSARYLDGAFRPLLPGRRYLLFLTYLPVTGAYRALNSTSSWDITDERVRSLNNATLQGFPPDVYQFIHDVRVATANESQKGRHQ